MRELLAVALLVASGTLPPIEPPPRPQPEGAPAEQTALPQQEAPHAAPEEEARPQKAGTAAASRTPGQAGRVTAPEGKSPAERKAGEGTVSGQAPGGSAIVAPSDEVQHAAVPALAPGALCEELRRAARDRREERAHLAAEREAVIQERAHLESLAQEIAQARQLLREETGRLQALLEKAAAGPAERASARGPAAPAGSRPGARQGTAARPPTDGALVDAAPGRR